MIENTNDMKNTLVYNAIMYNMEHNLLNKDKLAKFLYAMYLIGVEDARNEVQNSLFDIMQLEQWHDVIREINT